MLVRSFTAAVAAIALAPLVPGQARLDRSELHPVVGPPRYAGTFNVATSRWLSPTRANALRAASIKVYDNTCTWTGG